MQEEGKAMSGVGEGRVAVCKNQNKEFQSDDRVVKSQKSIERTCNLAQQCRQRPSCPRRSQN